MDKYLEHLLKEKERWEHSVSHAIQNQYNPYAENGTSRLEECRKELARITNEIERILKISTPRKRR